MFPPKEQPGCSESLFSYERVAALIRILAGCVLFVVYALVVLPSDSGSPPAVKPSIYPVLYQGMILVPLSRSKALHVHHWTLCALFFCAGILAKKKWYLLLTFTGLAALHGLFWYKDSLRFVQQKPWSH
jgi:hypothetical protein